MSATSTPAPCDAPPDRFSAQAFASALLDPQAGSPAGLKVWNGSDTSVRLDVYRNNVLHSLTGALATSFDVVRQLIGDECFRATAAIFIREHPPCSPVLSGYGDHFPGFLACFAPLSELPWLPDVARIEFLRIQAFHSADASVLSQAEITAFADRPQVLLNARLRLHPSVSVLRSNWNAPAIWGAHQGMSDLEDTNINHPGAALILRADDDAVVVAIPHATAHFIDSLQQGQTIGDSAQSAIAASFPDGQTFDFPATLGLLLQHQALSACIEQETAP